MAALARAVCWGVYIFNLEGLVYCFGWNRLFCARAFGSGSQVGCRSCFCAPGIVVLKRSRCSPAVGWRAGSPWLLCGLWWKNNTWGGSSACNSMERIVGSFRRRRASRGYGDSWRILDCLLRLSRTCRFMSWCSCCLRSPGPGCCGLMTPLFKGRGTPFHEWNAVLQSGTSARRRLGRGGALARSQQSAWPQHFLATSFVLPSTSCRSMARPSTCTGGGAMLH